MAVAAEDVNLTMILIYNFNDNQRRRRWRSFEYRIGVDWKEKEMIHSAQIILIWLIWGGIWEQYYSVFINLLKAILKQIQGQIKVDLHPFQSKSDTYAK